MKAQNQISVNYNQVIKASQNTKEVSKTLAGCRASWLSKYDLLTDEQKENAAPFYKVLKASIKDSVIYKELQDTTRKTKSGAYCEFYLLQAVYRQF